MNIYKCCKSPGDLFRDLKNKFLNYTEILTLKGYKSHQCNTGMCKSGMNHLHHHLPVKLMQALLFINMSTEIIIVYIVCIGSHGCITAGMEESLLNCFQDFSAVFFRTS